ncbi:hypothetical protein BT63DRAFT_89505 [Microthyrium microscopicum]|uniref:Uncharacterized protein n=1 Tax=Microthyrium microscopicum TaxID=703497 RepID=A0A6A6TZK1_9PEZI|nr:hypothetical protein BT63DRAFT_89505 [Microthyrium microscopicum]
MPLSSCLCRRLTQRSLGQRRLQFGSRMFPRIFRTSPYTLAANPLLMFLTSHVRKNIRAMQTCLRALEPNGFAAMIHGSSVYNNTAAL